MMHNLLEWRKFGNVKRYHTEQTIVTQTVAAHSHGVAMICLYFWPNSFHIMRAALVHDSAEYGTGDMPAYVSWNFHEVKEKYREIERIVEENIGTREWLEELTVIEKARLKFADYLELLLFCVEETRMGNWNGAIIFDRVMQLIPAAIERCGETQDRVNEMKAFVAYLQLEATSGKRL